MGESNSLKMLGKVGLMLLGFCGGVFSQWKLDRKDRQESYDRVERAEAAESAAKTELQDRDLDVKGWRHESEVYGEALGACTEENERLRTRGQERGAGKWPY